MPKPVQPEPPSPRHSLLAIGLTTVAGLAAYTVLVILSFGTFGFVLALGAGVFALAILHYLAWGWWLARRIRRGVEQEERASGGEPR